MSVCQCWLITIVMESWMVLNREFVKQLIETSWRLQIRRLKRLTVCPLRAKVTMSCCPKLGRSSSVSSKILKYTLSFYSLIIANILSVSCLMYLANWLLLPQDSGGGNGNSPMDTLHRFRAELFPAQHRSHATASGAAWWSESDFSKVIWDRVCCSLCQRLSFICINQNILWPYIEEITRVKF